MHITASVFINDDERGLHADYEKWLEEVCSRLHPAPTRLPASAGPRAGCTTAPARTPVQDGQDRRRALEADLISPETRVMGRQAKPRWLRSPMAIWTLVRGSGSSMRSSMGDAGSGYWSKSLGVMTLRCYWPCGKQMQAAEVGSNCCRKRLTSLSISTLFAAIGT
jgi:hypothetical protein